MILGADPDHVSICPAAITHASFGRSWEGGRQGWTDIHLSGQYSYEWINGQAPSNANGSSSTLQQRHPMQGKVAQSQP